MRVHKEGFDALVQYRIENLTDDLRNSSIPLKDAMNLLRLNPSPETLQQLMQLPNFDNIVNEVLHYEEGSDAELKDNYLRDVYWMLSLVAAVRESDVEKHLQAEQRIFFLYILLFV